MSLPCGKKYLFSIDRNLPREYESESRIRIRAFALRLKQVDN